MDTITAIATPAGSGGIGIIKISGGNAVNIAKILFRGAKNSPPDKFTSNRLYYGHIIDPETGRCIDEVLLSIMLAPLSYTREDVVEINAHSGPVVLKSILSLILKQGARLAEPGEFTKRAFINGRIDLTQAEAVVDLIAATSEKSLELATAQLKGGLGDRIRTIRESLFSILIELEAALDFPDDIEEGNCSGTSLLERLSRIQIQLQQLIAQHHSGQLLKEGFKLSIVGKPNVGKSSLLNRLLEKDRVIVTDIPGTTRDIIKDTIWINGMPVVVSDTAGIRKTQDMIESIGVGNTITHMAAADLILFMIEAGSPLTEEDHEVYRQIGSKQKMCIVNKIDLVDNKNFPGIPSDWEPIKKIEISALYNIGIDTLKKSIAEDVNERYSLSMQDMISPNMRHTQALNGAYQAIKAASENTRETLPVELISLDIKEAIDFIDEILGLTIKEDLLEKIFSQFCIGK